MATDLLINPITETPEEFDVAFENIKKEIHLTFLTLTKTKRKGFFISLEKAFWWLRCSYENTKTFRQNFKRHFLEKHNFYLIEAKDESDTSANYIYRNNTEGDTRIKLPWFSDEGFKILCMVSKAPKAGLVRQYYIELEYSYIQKLEMDMAELEIQRKQELAELEKFQSQSVFLNDENEDLKRGLDQRDRQVLGYFNQQIVLTDRIERLRDFERMMLTNEEVEPINNPYSILRMYECTFGKPIYVYLISDAWVLETIAAEAGVDKPRRGRRKKDATAVAAQNKAAANAAIIDAELNVSVEELREQYGLLNYKLDMDGIDFEGISSVWIRDYIMGDNDAHEIGFHEYEFYLYFAKSVRGNPDAKIAKPWETLYFYSDAHYAEFMQEISDLRLAACVGDTKIKNKILREVYKAPYSAIQSAQRDIAARMAVKVISQKKQSSVMNS